MRTIKQGNKGDDVAQWQTIVQVTADGIFGPQTREATIAWQSAQGLEADGIVGPLTWARAMEPKGELAQKVEPIRKAAVQYWQSMPLWQKIVAGAIAVATLSTALKKR